MKTMSFILFSIMLFSYIVADGGTENKSNVLNEINRNQEKRFSQIVFRRYNLVLWSYLRVLDGTNGFKYSICVIQDDNAIVSYENGPTVSVTNGVFKMNEKILVERNKTGEFSLMNIYVDEKDAILDAFIRTFDGNEDIPRKPLCNKDRAFEGKHSVTISSSTSSPPITSPK